MRPRKDIPDEIGRRILQLSRENNGSRAISKIIASVFPGHEYSHTHIQKYLNNIVPSLANPVEHLGTVQPIVHMHHLAGTALPRSVISQYPGSSSGQSWLVGKGFEEVDNCSDTDWVNQMNDSTDAFQYVIPNSFIPRDLLIEDPSTIMVEAMNEVINAIPRIGINSWKNSVLTDVWRKFNPEKTPPQQGNAKADVDKIKEALAKYEESEKREQVLKERAKQKEQEERAKYHESMEKTLDVLLEKVESFRDKKAVSEVVDRTASNENVAPATVQPGLPEKGKILDTTNAPGSGGSPETANNPGKQSLQEETPSSQEHNQPQSSNGVSEVPPPGPDIADKLRQPKEEEKHFPGLAGNGNPDGPQFPLGALEGKVTGQVDPSAISQISKPGFAESSNPPFTKIASTPPPPPISPKSEDQQSNGASNDQSSVQGILVTPVGTFLKAPSVNHNLRNALVVVGIGVAALYVFIPEVRQWVFSQYVHIFHKASPQSPSNGTFTQPQQTSNTSTQDYARVNDPHGVAFF